MDAHNLSLVTALRHDLHAHPELSGNEAETGKRLRAFLAEHSSLEVTDCGRWFYARKQGKESRPPLAFRADMDAVAMPESVPLPYASTVPGVAHKCGHDGHCAVLAGLALELDRLEPDRDVYCIFQHAEETGQGARECARLIREKGIEEVFAFHNMAGQAWGTVGMRAGTMNCASQGMRLAFTGLPAHASLPETGRNPAFAIADLVREIPDMVRPGTSPAPVWCTVIQVAAGSGNFGIAAGEGALLLTCRGEREADMLALSGRVAGRARALADRDGLDLEITLHDVFPETVNHPESVAKVRAACAALGYPFHEMPEPMRSSEDVGHFFKAAKGGMFLLHMGDRPPIHTPEYDFDDTLIERAVTIFTALAMERGRG